MRAGLCDVCGSQRVLEVQKGPFFFLVEWTEGEEEAEEITSQDQWIQEMNQGNESEETFNMQKLLREWTEVKMVSVPKEEGHRETEAV